MRTESIAVIGLWHLGSVLSACWAHLGYRVTGADESAQTITRLRDGRAPVFEPDLQQMLVDQIGTGRLGFTTDLSEAVRGADFVVLAYDTPVDAQDQSDLAPIERALVRIMPDLEPDTTVIVSSQVPAGTCAAWRRRLRTGARSGVDLAYSPENLRLGAAVNGYLNPERVVVGAADDRVCQRVTGLFSVFGAPILSMSLASAEMAKHALNGYLATSVSFANELASLCEAVGADILPVIEALKSDARVGQRAFLAPGLGFAGGTLARDVQALRRIGHDAGADTPLLDGVMRVNQQRAASVVALVGRAAGTLRGATVGVLGLTYKPGTSTVRRSVALSVVSALADAGARVRAFDPRADLSEVPADLPFERVQDAYEAADRAQALAILTDWPEFGELDFDRIRERMSRPIVIDARNCLTKLRLRERGFVYHGIGR